jgi:zinc transport system substrate-binding protein
MLMRRHVFALLVLMLAAMPATAAPKVLVTIKPVHALVAGVMAGVGQPQLLISGALSAHSYELKPSDARKLRAADIVFEIGPDMESYLVTPLKTLGRKVVVLEQASGVRRLPARHGGLWGEDQHGHGPSDPHIWLDPQNAIAMTWAIAGSLARLDPAQARAYRGNAARQVAMLQALDRELAAKLAPLKGRPYLVFHDAYHYLEARYGLASMGAVTVAPDRPVGARRVAELRQAVMKGRAVCLFREPQFPPKLIATLDENTRARVGVLDPLGAELEPGPGLYPKLMRDLAQSLTGCLGRNR